MVALLLWIGVASAQVVDTPWGPLSPRKAGLLCRAQYVFIGTIEQATPSVPDDGFFPGVIHSTLEFAVERDIKAAGQTFRITLPGGIRNGTTELVNGYPVPLVGNRYLMVVDRWSKDVGPAKAGDLQYKLSTPLDPGAPLASVEELRDGLQVVCAGLGGSR